jgi:hypothetical protein
LNITKMLLLEVGTYNDPFQRSYQAHVDGHAMDQLRESTRNGTNLTPAALSHVGANIMRISATTTGNVEIAEGFDTPRLCFMMEVEFPGTGGVAQIEWLMGFTDHIGVCAQFGDSNLAFNPNMRLYFNNVMRGQRVVAANSYGRAFHRNVSGTFQLINGTYRPNINNLNDHPHLMRPQDVFTSMSMEQTRSLLGDEEVLDIRPTHGPDKIAVSNRSNTIPGRYLSAVLQTWQTQTEFNDVDPASLNSAMSASVAEPGISRIRSLQAMSIYSELRQGGCLTWRELTDVEVTGTLEDRVVVVLAQSPTNRAKLTVRGESEYWHGNDQTTLLASQFVQAVPGMMMELMLTELDFSVTNQTLDGSFDVVMSHVESFNDGDNIQQVNAFVYRLQTQLMPGLTYDNTIAVTIHARFNVVAQTLIEISVNDGILTPFTAPSFCDGLFAAIRAPNARTLDQFSHNISKITNSLQQDRWAGGAGYEPFDEQHSPIVDRQGHRYESSGTL